MQSDVYSNIENIIFLDKNGYLLPARLLTQNNSSFLFSWPSAMLRTWMSLENSKSNNLQNLYKNVTILFIINKSFYFCFSLKDSYMILYSVLFSWMLQHSYCLKGRLQTNTLTFLRMAKRDSHRSHFLILGTQRDHISQSLLQLC